MSNYESGPSDNTSSTGEQIPHSGVHGFEKPVREFDNTPLSEAPLDYDPQREDELHTGHLPEELRVTREDVINERKTSRAKKIIAGIAATAALAVGGLVGAKAFGGNDNEAPAPSETVATEPADRSEQTPDTPDSVDISNITGRPTQEQIDKALGGIPGDLSPEDAIRYYGYIVNVYVNSADIDTSTNPSTESSASIESGDNLLKALYGPNFDTADLSDERKARLAFSEQIAVGEDIRKEYTHTITFEPDSSTRKDLDNNTTIMGYDEIKSDSNDNPNMDGIDTDYRITVEIQKKDNKWYVVDTLDSSVVN